MSASSVSRSRHIDVNEGVNNDSKAAVDSASESDGSPPPPQRRSTAEWKALEHGTLSDDDGDHDSFLPSCPAEQECTASSNGATPNADVKPPFFGAADDAHSPTSAISPDVRSSQTSPLPPFGCGWDEFKLKEMLKTGVIPPPPLPQQQQQHTKDQRPYGSAILASSDAADAPPFVRSQLLFTHSSSDANGVHKPRESRTAMIVSPAESNGVLDPELAFGVDSMTTIGSIQPSPATSLMMAPSPATPLQIISPMTALEIPRHC